LNEPQMLCNISDEGEIKVSKDPVLPFT
jgi:hypothetical protein